MVSRYEIEESDAAIRLTVPSWKGPFAIALLERRWWAVGSAVLIAIVILALVGGCGAVGVALWREREAYSDAGFPPLCLVEAVGIVVWIAASALWDWLWSTRGEEVIEVDGESLTVTRSLRLGGRRVPVGWPRRYPRRDIRDLRLVPGLGWLGRIALVRRRWWIPGEVRFAGGLSAEEAEEVIASIRDLWG